MQFLLLFLGVVLVSSCYQSKVETVGIQPFNDFDRSLTQTVKTTLEDVYGVNVIVLKNKQLPKSAFINVKSPRYRADSLLRFLKREKHDSIDCVIGLTTKDISTTKKDLNGNVKKPESKYKDWGVFGLGYRPGPSYIVSIHRIKPKNTTLFLSRFKKICMHEIGHNMGLKHCENNQNCVMRDAAEKLSTVDNVELKLCQQCLDIIN